MRKLILLIVMLLWSQLAMADLKSAVLAYKQGKFDVVVKETTPLAESGDAIAQYLLGSALTNAKPPVQDLPHAETWLMKSAEQGNVMAMQSLGNFYLFAKTPADAVQGVVWLKSAANHGDTEAQHTLGVAYLSGDLGPAKDVSEGLFWLALASQRGHLLSGVILQTLTPKPSAEQMQEASGRAKAWRPVWQ